MKVRSRHQMPRSSLCYLALGALCLVGGCRAGRDDLRLHDLTPGEELYCQRIVSLERARTIAWTDRQRGDALLDSLAAAWGDSVVSETQAQLSVVPSRAAAVGRLLSRIVAAEHDSLRRDPQRNRLGMPLPDPDRPAPPPPVWTPPAAPSDSA